MARWKLTAKHYLNVPGTEWEYSQNNRTTGKPMKVRFPVPTLLDPEDPNDWNYRANQDEGEVIVALAPDSAFPRDLIFLGAPTPDMFPLDDEAKSISAKFSKQWSGQLSTGEVGDPSTGHTKYLLDTLTAQVADLKAVKAPDTSTGMQDLLTAMAAMMKQNQEMMAALVKTTAPARRA